MIGDVDPAELLSGVSAGPSAAVQDLAVLLLAGDTPVPQSARLRLGVVTAVAPSPFFESTVSVRISGATTATPGIRYLGATTPPITSTVVLLQTAGAYLIIGTLNVPPALVRLVEGQTSMNANAWTHLSGMATPFIGARGKGLSVSGGVVTVEVAGWYRISAQAGFNTGGARHLLRVVDGTNPDVNVFVADERPGTGALPVCNGSTTIYLNMGTALRMFLYSTVATDTDLKSLTVEAV